MADVVYTNEFVEMRCQTYVINTSFIVATIQFEHIDIAIHRIYWMKASYYCVMRRSKGLFLFLLRFAFFRSSAWLNLMMKILWKKNHGTFLCHIFNFLSCLRCHCVTNPFWNDQSSLSCLLNVLAYSEQITLRVGNKMYIHVQLYIHIWFLPSLHTMTTQLNEIKK